jgi:superfamily II DNA helicase RecQ
MATIVDDIFRRRLKVLFVSPERLASAAFRRLLRHKERPFPPVSLLCVDEAHCLSQWGHNFRPSYLRIRSLLSTLQPRSILALTATAGPMVVRDVCCALDIPHDTQHESIISRHIPDIHEQIKDDTRMMALDNEEDTNVDCGVKVLSCNRDNIDVATLVFDHEEHRRSMVSWL